MSSKQHFRKIPRPPQRGGLPTYVWAPAAAVTGGVIIGYYAYLDEVPLTKRKRWIATSPQWEQQIGDQQHKALLKQYQGQILPKSHRASQTVVRVGSRIAGATQDFCKEQKLSHMSTSKPFTFTVVRSDQANAFVLPGNHIFVLTGLFRYVRDEDDLAAVLGHEMAHNVARHVGERVSSSAVVNIIASFLFLVDPSGALSALFMPAANILHSLPHSREAESEADRIGLELAARACYDPHAAKRVFSAMKEGVTTSGEQSAAPPEFISTHPSHARRISQFDDWMLSATRTFDGDDFGDRCRRVRDDMVAARRLAATQAAQREQSTTDRRTF